MRPRILPGPETRGTPRGPAALGLALALCVPAARAQWQTDTEPVIGSAETVTIATVRNGTGERFGVLRETDGRLRAFLEIAPGHDRLAPDGCPTYVVDDEPPAPLGENGGCEVTGREARVAVGSVEQGTLRSDFIWRLIMGGRLEVRYRLAERGYGTAVFTLIRSRQALTSAIGPGVEVVPP